MIVYRPATRSEPAESASSLTEVRTVGISPLGLPGNLRIPAGADLLVVFAHGSGSSRLSPRNMAVADGLNAQGMATLLFDLLTSEEEADRANVFDIPLLAGRVVDAVDWISHEPRGRPDLAGDVLDQIYTPTLLIVGGVDYVVIELNEQALARLRGPKALEIIPGASHLFPEPSALESVIDHAARWFLRYLGSSSPDQS